MSPLSDRPTAEVVILILAVVVGLSVLLVGAGIFALAVFRPDVPVAAAAQTFGSVIALLVGATSGYLAGRRGR